MGSSAHKQPDELHRLEDEIESLRRDNAQLNQRYVEAHTTLLSVTQSVRWRLIQALFRLFHYIIPEKSAPREKLKNFSRTCYRSLRSALQPNLNHKSEAATTGKNAPEKLVPIYELVLESTPACREFVQISPVASGLRPLELEDGVRLDWKLKHGGGILQ